MSSLRFLSSALILLSVLALNAQDKEYFQQRCEYEIDAYINDKDHTLLCKMTLLYINKSPDVLNEVHFHLWPNAYRELNSAMAKQKMSNGDFDFHFSTLEERGYIDSLSWSVNGDSVGFLPGKNAEHVIIPLSKPLLSGDTVVIQTPFRVKLPEAKFSRLGHVGQSYQATQWYPKPAVYDRDGWHVMPYLNQGEFYSEFGKYTVNVYCSLDYYVGGTGRFTDSYKSQLVQRAVDTENTTTFPDNSFPYTGRTLRNVRFEQDSVHDFAFFADKRFNVLHDTLHLPHSGRVIDCWVLFTNKNIDAWKKSMEYVKDGTRFYSQHVGDYPYDHVTVVDGTIAAGGGMEYPMVTIINSTGNDRALEKVIVHEIGHNWFYGILGSNEREHAWMDEGINSFYEVRYFEEKYGRKDYSTAHGLKAEVTPDNRGVNELGYLLNAREHLDQELSLCSHRYTSINYGVMVYSKASYLMQYLRAVLGTEIFDQAMSDYYETWKFKHPGPADFRRSLEKSTGQDLSWFFDDLIDTSMKMDFSVASYDLENQELTLKSHTHYEGPAVVAYYKEEQLLATQVIDTRKGAAKVNTTGFDAIKIDPYRDHLEMSRKNDHYRVKGIFKKAPHIRLKSLSRTGTDENWNIFNTFHPAWNDQDKFMLGLNLTNWEGLAKDWEWTVNPMYSLSNNKLLGMADLRKKFWLKETAPHRFTLGLLARRFSIEDGLLLQDGQYLTLKPSLEFRYIPSSLKDGQFSLKYTAHYVYEDLNQQGDITASDRENTFHVVNYDYKLTKGLFSTQLGAEYEYNEDFSKVSLDVENRFVYNKDKKLFGFRLYGAKLFADDGVFVGTANPSLSGSQGRQGSFNGDYRYDYLYLGRSAHEGSLSRQHVRDRGGFSYDASRGSSNNWVAALNLYSDLPVSWPVMVYANIGAFEILAFSNGEFNTETQMLYEGGLRLNIVRDAIDMSFPLVFSDGDGKLTTESNQTFGQRIKFQLRLEKLKLRKIIFENLL